ncbi:MAG: fumarylacetoacetate hydrolase family protein [Promethearchaeota archaeon]|jgi:2-keto-4-pentenoate hydratase/2-oxohepta-3-ene-1,7-dioic acid hydratase in catechol pathway
MRNYLWKTETKDVITIGKVICLARTYKKHAKEMSTEVPKNPIIFLKPSTAIIFSGDSIIYPPESKCLHHEIEFGVVIGQNGKDIFPNEVFDHILGYCVALDITARDIQNEAKINGLPWTIAKGFDTFAPISEIIRRDDLDNPNNTTLELTVNGEIRQKDNTSNMIWTIQQLVSYISKIMTLEKGDLILTGTPSGVSEIKRGDIIQAQADIPCFLEVDVI